MTKGQLRVGAVLYGFCNGQFGRDSYEDKRVEAIGADWVVARDTRGVVWFAGVTNPDNLMEFTDPDKSQP